MRLRVHGDIAGERRLVGILETVPGREEQFTYDTAFMTDFPQAILSIGLPFQDEPFSSRKTRAFFRNMLPEGNALVAVAKRLGVCSSSYLQVLGSLGNECIGALIVEGPDSQGAEEYGYRPLARGELAGLAREGADGMALLQETSKLSLAGAQSKMGLCVSVGLGKPSYSIPLGTAASTHIVKTPNRQFDLLSENEHCCLELAKRCGLDAASSFIDVMEDGVVLFVTKRYDRLAVPGSAGEPAAEHVRVDRLHQEDFCQVLGKLPERKYEEPGQRFSQMIRDAIFEHSEDPVGDVTAFIKLLMLNAIVGNCDGHLKNLSFVRSEDWTRSRLSPVYDIASTVVYEKLDRHMGMRIGDASKVDEVTRADFIKLSDDLHLSKRAMGRMLDEVCQGVEASIDEVVLSMEDELCYKLPVLWDLAKFAKGQINRLR